jgi:hypothetical protein
MMPESGIEMTTLSIRNFSFFSTLDMAPQHNCHERYCGNLISTQKWRHRSRKSRLTKQPKPMLRRRKRDLSWPYGRPHAGVDWSVFAQCKLTTLHFTAIKETF